MLRGWLWRCLRLLANINYLLARAQPSATFCASDCFVVFLICCCWRCLVLLLPLCERLGQVVQMFIFWCIFDCRLAALHRQRQAGWQTTKFAQRMCPGSVRLLSGLFEPWLFIFGQNCTFSHAAVVAIAAAVVAVVVVVTASRLIKERSRCCTAAAAASASASASSAISRASFAVYVLAWPGRAGAARCHLDPEATENDEYWFNWKSLRRTYS